MKRLMIFGTAGLLTVALPALALAQTTPQAQSRQTMPQQMQQRSAPVPQPSGVARKEVATAHAHALMAQNAKSVEMVHTHLHHVINCLEGRAGTDFDAEAGNPCKDMGHGAIPDSMTNQTMQASLKQALATAQTGIQASDLAKARQSAAQTASLLQVRVQPMPDDTMHQP